MSDQTERFLEELDERIIPAAYWMIVQARQAGIPLVITSGRRSPGHNAAVGGVPGSWHLQGLAFDVAVLGYPWRTLPGWWWEGLGQFGEHLGLRWGGRFSMNDPIHFDLPVSTFLG